jgi:Cyclic nucleotide-binding domain
MPHAHTVAYANDASRIYFVAIDGSQAVRNINDNRYVSFTIDDYTTDWRKVRELQGVGRCGALSDDEHPVGMDHFARKFGPNVALPQGLMFGIQPFEMHFVDYTYEAFEDFRPVQPVLAPEITSRVYVIDEKATRPSHAAVATNLNRTAYSPGEVIFKPGDPVGQYFVVVEGEVEVRGEGFGADQTVTRVGPGKMFGDQAALLGQRGALTAYAVKETVVLSVEREAMRDFLLPRDGQ